MKKKILIPIFILMISLVAVVTASWQILNFKENKVPSEYFPYEVNAVQNVIYDGQEHDVTVTLTEGSVVDNNDLIIEYYRYTTSIDKDDVIHNITLLQNEKPKHSGIYIAKIYRMVDVTTEDRGVTQEKEEIYNVRLNINKRQVIVSSYADKFIYFGQDTSGVTFGYDIEQALEGSDRGLVAGDELKESSSFVLDAGYKKYQTYGVCTIAISGLYDVNDNYEIIYNPGEFHVKQLPISFSWDTNSLKTIYSGKYQRPSIGTYSTSVEGVDMAELLQNVNFNAIYDTDTTKLINAGLYDVTCTGFDNPNFIFDESGSTDYKDTAFEIEKCKVNYSWYTDSEQKLIFNGTNQHQKAYLTSIVDGIDVEMVVDSFKLLENESNNNERDTTYINYKTSGEIEANVNKNGDKLYADLYTIELLSLSNPNYEFAEGSTSTTYKIYPKELTLAWHEDNSFVFSNKPQIVEADEIGLIDNYPSGLYFDGAETNANYVNEETMIPSYTNSDNELITFNKYYSTAGVTSTNYYLAEDNIKNEFKITQLEVFITWGSQVEFVYNGQMNSHCPTGLIALETGYPDAGLTILGSEVNANSDHLGNKYNGFDDYMAQAKISNTNYKLLENTTCDFKVKASPLVVGINEDLPDGAVSINSTSRSLSRNTSYADITYEYFGKRFIPTAFYEGTLYGDDTCSVDVKYVKDNGTLSAEGALDVGTYLAKTVGLSNTNYSIVEEKTINVVINPRPIYISWENLEFNYDSESHLPTVSISNLCDIDIPTDPNADPLVYVRVDNSFAQTNANITYTGGNLIAGFNRYPVSLTSNNITNEAGEVVKNYLVYGSRGHNYICSTESLCENTFTIRQAQLTINALKNEITYGDVPSLSKTSHIELVGLKPNDTIDSLTNLTYDINYKQYYDVTNALKNVSYEASWTGVTNTNYEITYNSAEFVVNRKPVTISWDTVTTHVYSSSLWAPEANIIGLVNDDKVSVEIAGKQKDTNVKTGLTYNASIVDLISDDSLDQADNYIISNPDTTQQFTITQKPVTINWTNTNLTYTSGLQFAEYEFVGVLNNEDLLETISGNQTDANKNSKGVFGSAYTASITEIGNLNYMFASNADKEEEFYINALGITVNWITPEFSYKGITQLPTISSLSTIYDSDINSVSTNITASSESTIAGFIAGIWAGSHKATAQLTGAKASNYEIINNETFDYNISKAPLEVILNGNNIIYGDAPVDNGYTIKGFENGETVAVLGNSISYTHSYSRYGNIGDYDINASGFTSNNYEITYTKATLTVEARKVEITFADLDSYVYKKGDYAPIATVTNLAKASDECIVELTKFSDVGKHVSEVVSISNSNYTIEGTSYSHEFTITPKPITINWSGTSGLIYDSTVQKISAVSTDIIDGDTVSYTITYTAGDGKNAGSHTAKVEIDNKNYTIAANETVSYSIEAKEITIEWTNLEFTYVAGQTYCPTATAGGLLGDDTCELIVEGAASSVGKHTATVTDISNKNYKLPANTSTTFEIIQTIPTTTLTVTIYGNVTIKYGDDLVLEYTTQAPTVTQSKVYYTISGFRDGDSIDSLGEQLLSLTTNYIKGNNVGTYTITGASGFTLENYEIEYVIADEIGQIVDEGQLTVTPREITIEWTQTSFVYDGKGHLPEYSLSGVLTGDECAIEFKNSSGVALTAPTDYRNGGYTANVSLNNGNYTIKSNNVYFEITKRTVTITWNTSNLTYNSSEINPLKLGNVVDNDDVKPIFNKSIKNAGSYNDVAIIGLTNSNYQLPSDGLSASFRVNKATPVISTYPTLTSIYEGQSSNLVQNSGKATINGGATQVAGTFILLSDSSTLKFVPGNSVLDTTQKLAVRFTPVDTTNYVNVTIDVAISIKAVASVGYKETYYGSVDAAVNAANIKGSGYVYVLPLIDYIPAITTDLTINSGVTLILPCRDENMDNKPYIVDDSANKNVVYSKLYIPYGVTLTVNGTLNVTSVIEPGGKPNVAVIYERGVIMNDGKIIANSGTINAYGYIKGTVRENDLSGNGSIELINSTLKDVFRIHNWPGGKNAKGLAENNIVPFSVYSYHNVSCTLKINKGSKYSSLVIIDLTLVGVKEKEVTLVGSGGLFELENGYICKLVEETTKTLNVNTDYISSNQDETLRGVFEVNGDVIDNSISIKEGSGSLGIDITTGPDYPMPIGFMSIRIKSGTTKLQTNSYKLLPGSELIVYKGATLIIDSRISAVVYDDFPEDYTYTEGSIVANNGRENSIGYYNHISDWVNKKYGTEEFGAQFIVEGTFICNGNFGGIIKGRDGGMVTIANNFAEMIEIAQLTYASGKLEMTSTAKTKKLSHEALGYINGDTVDRKQFSNNVTYYYNSSTGTWGTPITISYSTNHPGLSIPSKTINNGSAGYIIPNSILNSISRNGYTLSWYIDSSLTTPYDVEKGVNTNTTLYAKWTPNTYNVSFDSQGGLSVNNITVTYDQAYGTLPIPTKPGYVFTGWTLNDSLINESTIVSQVVDHTLVATWEAATYTVTFDSKGGSSVASMTVTYNTVYGTLPTPVLEGFLFKGWKLGDSIITDKSIVTETSNHTLVATWEEITQLFKVTFNYTNGQSKVVEYNNGSTYGELEQLSKDGYTFVGWYSEEDGKIVSSEDIITKDVNLTPRFTANTYQIIFDANGGSGNMSNQTHTYDASLALSINTFTKAGYTFAGWLYDGTSYVDEAEIKNLTTNADDELTFVAQWTPISYTVKFDANGGTGNMSNQTHTYGTSLTLSANEFKQEGYHFAGWLYDGIIYGDEQSVSNLTTVANSEVTLVAQWEGNIYNVVFTGGEDASGNMSGFDVINGAVFELPNNEFIKPGYEFAGWSYNGTTYQENGSVTLSGFEHNSSHTFVAQWSPINYTIIFRSNDGSDNVIEKTITYGSGITLKDVLGTETFNGLDGYHISYWASDYGEFTSNDTIDCLVTETNVEVEFIAIWINNTYTIIFDANGGSGSMDNQTHTYDMPINLSINTYVRTGYVFNGWKYNGESYTDGQLISNLSTIHDDKLTFIAQWTPITYTVHFNSNGGTGTMADQLLTYDATSLNANTFEKDGYKFVKWNTKSDGSGTSYDDKAKNISSTNGAEITLYAIWEEDSGGWPCIAEGTLITLANGTKIPVEQLTGSELLLVWNHTTGRMDYAKIAYIVDHDKVRTEHKVMTMNFNDGTYIKIIGEHVFYDATLNKYVAIDSSNYTEYIGHKFLKTNDNNSLVEIEFISATINVELTRTFEVVTDKHLINFTNDILSTSAYLDPLLNVFDINPETYAYDIDQMIKDIEEYGLYTYDDFEGLIDEKAFELYNAAYLKVAVGKGYITWDDIIELINIYYDVEVKPLTKDES